MTRVHCYYTKCQSNILGVCRQKEIHWEFLTVGLIDRGVVCREHLEFVEFSDKYYCSGCYAYVPRSECNVQYIVGLMHNCPDPDEKTARSASAYDTKEEFEKNKRRNIEAVERRKKESGR